MTSAVCSRNRSLRAGDSCRALVSLIAAVSARAVAAVSAMGSIVSQRRTALGSSDGFGPSDGRCSGTVHPLLLVVFIVHVLLGPAYVRRGGAGLNGAGM